MPTWIPSESRGGLDGQLGHYVKLDLSNPSPLEEILVPYPFPHDVQEAIGEHMASGKYACEDDLLRDALKALAEIEEDAAAVREAIAQWQGGDVGVPLDEAIATVRSRRRPGRAS
jgi:Arc/MetJ-type ribon-helix-helix transcriptional regulator